MVNDWDVVSGAETVNYFLSNITAVKGAAITVASGGGMQSARIKAGARLTVNANGSVYSGYIYGEEIIKGMGYDETIYAGGRQTILQGGSASYCNVEKGGVQLVSAGGSAQYGYVKGSQTIYSGGQAQYATVSSGGRQTILQGGLAEYCNVEIGGVQLVSSGGLAQYGYIKGSQTIYSGGQAQYMTVSSGGRQTILKGGLASNSDINFQGVQIISAQGTAKNSYVCGSQTVARGGIASNCNITAGGSQTVLAGGKAIGTILNSSASMTLAGTASGAQIGQIGYYINQNCVMTIKKGGVARNTLVGDKLIVASGGVASATTIANGAMTISKGGAAKGVTMYGGKLNVLAGGSVSNITAEYPTYYGSNGGYDSSWNNISFGKNITLGGANKFRCATVSASGGALTVKSGSTLTLHNARLLGFTTNVAGAAINIRSYETKVLAFGKVNAKTSLNFDLTKDALTESRMAVKPDLLTDTSRQYQTALTVGYEQSYNGKVSISVNGLQILRTYQLCDGLNFKKNASVSIKLNGKSVGSVKVGGTLRKNGVSYQLRQTDGGQYKLNMTAIAGVMRKGTSKNETLTGGANCDIFYGGAGNDVIKGVNGHDVVFYDTKKWGKDTIAATNGSVTLYMAGLDSGFLSTAKKGKDLVITRDGIAGDSITIKNYDENRHNIIYGGTLGEFSKYLKTAKPTAAIETAGREVLWKKTGLLA